MEIVLYLIGTTLLVVPSSFLVRGRHKLVTLSHALESGSYLPHILTPVNVIDFFRAWLGAILVCHEGRGGFLPFFLVGLILTVGTVLQQCFVRDRDSDDALPAPMAYLAGLALGALPLFTVLITLVGSVTVALALRYACAFHLTGATCILAHAILIPSDRFRAALLAVLFSLPVIIALLCGRALELRVKEWGKGRSVFYSPMRDVVIPASGRDLDHMHR